MFINETTYAAMIERAAVEVLLNIGAGSGAKQTLTEDLAHRFELCGIRARILWLREGDDVDAAARRALAAGPDMIVAGGGDGTLSTVAGVLAGTPIPLGVLPLGTLNHFAKDLEIPMALASAVDTLCRGQAVPVDVGRVNGRVFINNSSLGLYPHVVKEREALRRRLGHGKGIAFLRALFSVLRRFPFFDVRIRLDQAVIVRRTPLLFVGNNSYELDALNFGTRKRLDAAHLSVHVINRTDRWRLLLLAARAVVGRLKESRDFESFEATHVEVNTRRGRITVAVDGELYPMKAPLIYDVFPGALRVMVPVREATRAP